MNETIRYDGPSRNDYETIAREIDHALAVFTGNAHEPGIRNDGRMTSDSITITKDGFITGVIRLQRLRDWAEGLALTHWKSRQGETEGEDER